MLLLFGAVWLFPLITALVAGDIFASEDHNGTLKTILTRSLERGQIFAGKALAAATYAVVAIVLSGTVAVIAGSIQSGFNSLQTLSGTVVSAPKALELVYVGLLVYLIPIVTIVAIGLLLSTITRNSAAAVVGTLMVSLLFQLIGILPGLGGTAAVPAEHAVQRLAGAAAPADRLGAGRPGRVGLRDVRRAGAGGRVPGVPAPRRGRWLRSTRPRRRRRPAAAADARAHADGRGLRGDGRRRRRRRAGRGRALRPRRDRARRGDSRARRPGGGPPAARQGTADADPDADRARRGARSRRGTRGGRRRLPGQAVRRCRSWSRACGR